MNQINSLFTLRLTSSAMLGILMDLLEEEGLRAICSFDLQAACASFEANICPDHGEDPCDCQMVVLLVYGPEGNPLSLVLHGHNGRVQVGIKEEPQAANLTLENRVRAVLDTNRIIRRVRQTGLVNAHS